MSVTSRGPTARWGRATQLEACALRLYFPVSLGGRGVPRPQLPACEVRALPGCSGLTGLRASEWKHFYRHQRLLGSGSNLWGYSPCS